MKLQNKIALIGLVIGAALLQGCLTEPELKMPFDGYKPVEVNDGWEISTPEAEGIDGNALAEIFIDFHNNEDIWQARSLSVFRNGKLVAESYTKDPSDRTTQRAIWSCTKQFTGVLVGIAIEKGLITSIDDPISKYLPNQTAQYPDKKDITIKDCLTMSTGIDYDNYGLSGDDSQILQQIPDNYLDFVLGKSMIHEPGTEYKYKDSDPQILSSVIESVTGKKMDIWAEEALFSKLGIENYSWKRYKDGATLGSFGIMTTPREFTKLAQMVLNGGTFNGNNVINQSYINDMVAAQKDAGDKAFGYLWWSYPEHNTYFMSGNGRQLAFVFPDKNLIVTITSETNVQGKYNLSTPVARDYGKQIVAICN